MTINISGPCLSILFVKQRKEYLCSNNSTRVNIAQSFRYAHLPSLITLYKSMSMLIRPYEIFRLGFVSRSDALPSNIRDETPFGSTVKMSDLPKVQYNQLLRLHRVVCVLPCSALWHRPVPVSNCKPLNTCILCRKPRDAAQ
jgi:hypothetical protein